ncbi:MAG TPA: glycosyltransferase family A protein [Thermoanaerobaculia bacterium]|jgi:glycosyltransferase involved in cell wall biosynthesis|nr:glycosyltransferase family A protein [Thermoanaerobaculia bacterium]
MQQGLVSTIIPVFNRAVMLREAVASVLAQTYRPIEIIIVDDGSTDDTPQAIRDLERHHTEVRGLRRSNGGAGLARETGRLEARGEFIQYLDSDDLLLPRKLELQVRALREQPECGVAYGITTYRDLSGNDIECAWKPANQIQPTIFPSFLVARWWDTPAPLYRTSVCDAAGPWTDLRLEEDWEYDCRIGAMGTLLARVNEPVTIIREHSEGRLSGIAGADPSRLRDRAKAHELIAAHAQRAGVAFDALEFQHFARELFHLGRQCGLAGLPAEAKRLVALAGTIAPSADVRVYQLAAKIIGWRGAGRASTWIERVR